ncbi:MAG: hypothetical protein ACRD3M_05395 [Thermoanaerobaculia bacterium]
MPCPECGEPMNCHAEKVDYGAGLDAPADPHLGGVVALFHSCRNPECGLTVERPARAS